MNRPKQGKKAASGPHRTYRDTLFFHHTVRIGKGGKPFVVSKFRTMKRGAHAQRDAVLGTDLAVTIRNRARDPRVLKLVGKPLRKTHLDELPQILGVLRGELNPVGIRPLPRSEFQRLPSDIKKIYLEIGPGMLGVEYACRPFPPTPEKLFEEYRRYYTAWKRNPVRAQWTYARKIFVNKTFHAAFSD